MIVNEKSGMYFSGGKWLTLGEAEAAGLPTPRQARLGTMASAVLKAHNRSESDENIKIVFDALASHDITFVGIIQTARASGLKQFPVPYVLTNCHNSLCAVGGTINEDDHLFGLSAAQRYGGIFVPAHMAVIHQYMREMVAGCGKMILGSDSHTRYGALGTMAIGEGGGELAKQLLGRTYDLKSPEVVAVWLEGVPQKGVGPHDIALSLVGSVFKDGFVKNKVLEFLGPGVDALSVEYRMGIDVMTTETTCLSSIWKTDTKVKEYLALHGRESDYKPLAPLEAAYYDGLVKIDLSKVEPMIALPFHPSNVYPITYFNKHAKELLAEVEVEAVKLMGGNASPPDLQSKVRNGRMVVDQAVVAGCSGGTFENLMLMAEILKGYSTGDGKFGLSLYPASQPQFLELVRNGAAATLMAAGATMRTAFCGPCFGAGDVPAQNCFSIRHTTRNFPNREGSKPSEGQIAYVALMDARSIAATSRNKGLLTAATELDDMPDERCPAYKFDFGIYNKRIYNGWKKLNPQQELICGPNIVDWPKLIALPDSLLLTICATLYDSVTTTDEIIPSGEASSFRSNPLRMSEFTLSRREPQYVSRAKAIMSVEAQRRAFLLGAPLNEAVTKELAVAGLEGQANTTGLGSLIFALKPGDGSAREQAASCQKVLGGWANIASVYATKRYRSNLVNWGILPFIIDNAEGHGLVAGDRVYIPGIRVALLAGLEEIEAYIIQKGTKYSIKLRLPEITKDERDIILAGCLINYYTG